MRDIDWLGEQQEYRVKREHGEQYRKDYGDELFDARELEVGAATFRRAQYFPFFAVSREWQLLFYAVDYLKLSRC